jgi:hypothetical protein
MINGNKKYDFTGLVKPGDTYSTKPANIYSLKSAMRQYFGAGISITKSFTFEDEGKGNVLITRLELINTHPLKQKI